MKNINELRAVQILLNGIVAIVFIAVAIELWRIL